MNIDKILESRIWPAAWGAFCRVFILAGLSLLAWGLDDVAGFLSNTVRAGLLTLVALDALFLAWLDYVTPPQPERGDRHDPSFWHAHISEGIYILAAFGDRRDVLTWSENETLRWVGLAATSAGLILALWANISWATYLRRNPERVSEDRVLLTDGPFRFIRYPNLLALVFYCLGSTLIFRSWVGLVLLVPLSTSIIARMNELERTYADLYSRVWPMRTHTSKRIIPFVY